MISPALLGTLSDNPALAGDRFSRAHLVATAARTVRDVAVLRDRASRANQRLATFGLESEVSFASPADFKAFSEDLTQSVAQLVAAYHRPDIPGSRPFRVAVVSHPSINKSDEDAESEAAAPDRTRAKENT